MPYINGDDDGIRKVLKESQTIALVGHSDKPERASYQISKFLRQLGYTIIPINPMVQNIGQSICYPSLNAVPTAVDIVNVFRRSDYLSEIMDEAIAISAPTVWAQIGVSDRLAFQKALDAGLNVIMDRCIKVECIRLGINSARL